MFNPHILDIMYKLSGTIRVISFLILWVQFLQMSAQRDITVDFRELSPRELKETADQYYHNNAYDSALIHYSLVINGNDSDNVTRKIESLYQSALIYYKICDYRSAYEMLLRATELSDLHEIATFRSRIYNLIGNIYYRFGRFDLSEQYYNKALKVCSDSANMVTINNNLGAINIETKKYAEALKYLNRSLNMSEQSNDRQRYGILNNIALIHLNEGRYDEARHYLDMSIAGHSDDPEINALNLQNMATLYRGKNLIDSATYYLRRSNKLASDARCLNVLKDNHLILSQIEENKGNTLGAFEYFKTYAALQDSIYGADKLGEINQLQSTYEISKANRRIEQMNTEQKIKEETIKWRTTTLVVTAVMLLLAIGALVIVWIEKKKLNEAYRVLYEKSKPSPTTPDTNAIFESERKDADSPDSSMIGLLDRIRNVMATDSEIFDPYFSVDRLATLVQSNHSTVSKAINIGLHKNFRTYLNEFRIKEAQRILSSPENAKLTMEAIALKVGFRSRGSFSTVFKEATGISPSYFLKSFLEEKQRKNADNAGNSED